MQTTGAPPGALKKKRAEARLELLAEAFSYWMTPSMTFGTAVTTGLVPR